MFGEHARNVSISATKSMTGHALGAAGALESVAAILATRDDVVPPTINYEQADPDCELDYTPNVARKRSVHYAMNDSFGFGGQNSILIFKKHENGTAS